MPMTFARKISTGMLLLLSAALITGCATKMPTPEPRLAEVTPLKRALLVTEDVEIEVLDADGSMPARIVPSEPFRPGRLLPYAPRESSVQQDDLTDYDRDTGYYGIWWNAVDMRPGGPPLVHRVIRGSPADLAGLEAGDGVYLMRVNGKKLSTNEEVWELTSEYRQDIPMGETLTFEACQNAGNDARSCPDTQGTMQAVAQPRPYRVLVHVPGRDKPLYGRLAFFHVYSTASGSASRIYRLQVPQQYVERARGGNVSVVYQPYTARYRSPLSGKTGENTKVSWALWLSDVPFD